jgi:cytochrome c oxidase assembly protein subunit 15
MLNDFKRLVSFTLFLTYVVILAGAVVRGTGSGLGCPDWPRCFGSWVPPLEERELPANYKEIYKIAGKEIADFDPFKTWTEYLNRMLGALLGVFILTVFIKSFKHTDKEKNLPWFCGFLLFMVIIQGGVGAFVVSSHLKPYIITLHMLLALILLFGLHYLSKFLDDLSSFQISFKPDEKNLTWTKLLIFFTMSQTLMGTQVRQSVDYLTRDTNTTPLNLVIEHLGWIFYVHRSFSMIVFALAVFCTVRMYKQDVNGRNFKYALAILILILGNVASGIALNYNGFPAEMQPVHLFCAVMVLGMQFKLYLSQKGNLL